MLQITCRGRRRRRPADIKSNHRNKECRGGPCVRPKGENVEEENNKNETKEKKKISIKLKTIIIIGIIVAVVIVGIIVYAKVLQKNNYRSNEPYFDPGCPMCEKPIIYLYPETNTEISVKLGKAENITCSYPEYKNGWNVIANPDGTLIDNNTGRKLYSLYWEGIQSEPINFEEGFVVAGKDSIQFLEKKLAILGLNEIEAEEFIVYWLPKLESNKYNFIRFQTEEEINNNMPLEITPKPDTVIRIVMEFKGIENPIQIQEQKLITPQRTGFTVVEWGGTEIK